MEKLTKNSKPKATKALELDAAAGIIESRQCITSVGNKVFKVMSEPTEIVIDNEDDQFHGETVHLVNLNADTPDLRARADATLDHALDIALAGDIDETAELFAQDAASYGLVFRVLAGGYVPKKGKMVECFVDEVIPKSGDNEGKPVFRIATLTKMGIDGKETKRKKRSSTQDKLAKLGFKVDSKKASSSKPKKAKKDKKAKAEKTEVGSDIDSGSKED